MNMAIHNVQDKDTSLLLSSDARPRLKWTPELHQRFVEAVNRLGGAEKATPKSLMRIMGIHGLTLYHLKSHLQKYRLGKSQNSPQSNSQNKQEFIESYTSQISEKIYDEPQGQNNESSQISQALQIQMEVERTLHEQIKVQKHMQSRIEAQGKYLQSVMKKAQETLSNYHSSSIGIEVAKAELSKLVSLVDTSCNSYSFTGLTEIEGSLLKESEIKLFHGYGYSPESSQTSSESSGRKDGDLRKADIYSHEKSGKDCVVLPLMELHPPEKRNQNSNGNGIKRNIESSTGGSGSSDGQESRKRCHQVGENNQELKMFNFMEPLDFNSNCRNDYDKSPSL